MQMSLVNSQIGMARTASLSKFCNAIHAENYRFLNKVRKIPCFNAEVTVSLGEMRNQETLDQI